MHSRTFKGFGVAAALAITLAGCSTSPTREAQTEPRFAPLSAGPADRLATEAMAFESFMHNGSGIAPGFSSSRDVAEALDVGASHEPRQLDEGLIAYAAMAALQEPSFVAGVRREAHSGDLAARLAANPAAVSAIPGAQAASARAAGALLRQGEALAAEGERVKRASYSVQHQKWSKARISDPRGRLDRVKRLSSVAYQPTRADAARLQSAIGQSGRRFGSSSPVVERGVALAALKVLGQESRGRALMSEPASGSCLRLAKLNLYQCLAAAGPQYEDIYCLGQHALLDPGQCVVDAVREPPPRRAWRR